MVQSASTVLLETPRQQPESSRSRIDVVAISLLLLFLELACIRWFPSHVLYLTFFTNTVLLAAFLGMSLGCLAADRPTNLLAGTLSLLAVAMIVAQLISAGHTNLAPVVRVGNQQSPELVFFGTEFASHDPTQFVVPIEVVEAFFFVAIALVMMGPGQELGRSLKRVPNRLQAYSLNIAGSLVGIALFAACSLAELPPIWWFGGVGAGLAYFLFVPSPDRPRVRLRLSLPALIVVVIAAVWTSGSYTSRGEVIGKHLWSPYYRVDYDAVYSKMISVNLIGHQIMVSRDDHTRPSFAYALPHMLRRDAGGAPFANVLVVGAGSGNDVSRALAWGATHVDAVEIDPVIQRLGATDHPDHPYSDPRVTVHIADGRNFLRTTTTKYDLIVFALIDSLVLHSGYSNIRLESFLFTQEALMDAQKRLNPGGMFVVSNYFRQGWIVARLQQAVAAAFGKPPVVLTLPFVDTIRPDSAEGLTMLLAGGTEGVEAAFARSPSYWLSPDQPPSPASPSGFDARRPESDGAPWVRIGKTVVEAPDDLRPATDDWPFLYLRSAMVPALSLRGMAIMAGLALALFAVVMRTGATSPAQRGWLDGRMFFLGAGFMLIETRAVVHMALLFGSTWMVNTIVFAGVLVMILGANLFVARMNPRRLGPYYAGLFLLLLLNTVVPLDALLGLSRPLQILGSCGLALTPILFSGVIFAVSFRQSAQPDRDFGANVAGAMAGGLAENASMLLGFRYLTLVVIVFYALSAWRGRKVPALTPLS